MTKNEAMSVVNEYADHGDIALPEIMMAVCIVLADRKEKK